MVALSAGDIEQRAAVGDVPAQLELGRQLDAEGKWDEARAWLRRAAETGDPAGKIALGQHLISKGPYDVAESLKWTHLAAADGHPDAFHLLAVVTAEGLGVPQNWQAALDHLLHAAEHGHKLAQGQLMVLSGNVSSTKALAVGEAPQAQNWQSLRASIDLSDWLKPPEALLVSAAPRIATADKFLPIWACDWLIERARPWVDKIGVYDPQTGTTRLSDMRTNSSINMETARLDIILALARARITALTGFPVSGFEDASILHYDVGEQYTAHYDFFVTTPAFAQEIAMGGQRVLTFLIYLNEEFEGGETEFPMLARRYRQPKGGALFFWNVGPDGQPDRRSLHAGLAPTSGEKWLFSQWVRFRLA